MKRWSKEALEQFALYPHLLGYLVGYDKLIELHSYWIHYIWDTISEEKTLQAHRNSYKTTSIIIVGTIYWLLFHPDDRIAIIRKTFTEAAKSVRVIGLLFDNPIIKSLFKYAHGIEPKKLIEREGKILFNFKQTKTQELSIEAHGLDYGITGAHYDKIICDDIITLRDRISKAEREKTKQVLEELRTNIIEPNKAISVVGTPWHRNDAWKLLPKGLKFDVYKTNILSEEEIAIRKKRTLPSLFNINYLLKDTGDEKSLFKDPKYTTWKNSTTNYLHLDAAFDGDHYCALTLLGDLKDKYQIKGWVYAGNVKDWLTFIKVIFDKYNCKWIAVENNADKGYTADKLQELGLKVKRYDEKTNKHLKIATILYTHWDRIYFDNDINEDYIEQIIDYKEKQEPDDAPDSLSSLLRFFVKTNNIKDITTVEEVGSNINY